MGTSWLTDKTSQGGGRQGKLGVQANESKGCLHHAAAFPPVRYVVEPVAARALAGPTPPAHLGLDGDGAAVERLDRPERVDPLRGRPGAVGAKHRAAVQPLAVESPDRRAAPVRGLAAAGSGGVPGSAALGGVGYHGAVERVLRGAAVPGLPGPDDSPGGEGLAASERERRVRDYRGVLGFVARLLRGYEVVLLADRGFLHGEWLRGVGRTAGWPLRVRGKRNVGLFRRTGRGDGQLALRRSPGEVRYYHGVSVTGARLPVHLAVGWEKGAKEPWIIVSDEPTDAETLDEYGRRFTIEEGFLDDQSNGFPWESSQLRTAEVLQRLGFVMAVATWVLVCQGVEVVAAGKRRQVDPHWFRGHRYARIGWNWIRRAAARGEALIGRLALLTAHDPEPARASRRQVDRSRWMDDLPQRYIFLIPAPSMS